MPLSTSSSTASLYYEEAAKPTPPMPPPPTQKMLLTKPLTKFLHLNHTPQIHTLLLTTPTGRLLCSSSPLCATILRQHATLASQLYALYNPLSSSTNTSSTSLVSQALPQRAQPRSLNGEALACVCLQLDFGTMVIQQLDAALLFVVVGPSSTGNMSGIDAYGRASQNSAGGISNATALMLNQLENLSVSSSQPSSPPTQNVVSSFGSGRGSGSEGGNSKRNGGAGQDGKDGEGVMGMQQMETRGFGGLNLAVPERLRQDGGGSEASEAGSVSTVRGKGGVSVRALKRQAEELGRCLNNELSGFWLSPDPR